MSTRIKRVNMAKPEYETSETVVFWDMDNCPLPNGYDPCLLAPRIDTELEDLGYDGPLMIVAAGNLYGIPNEFLRALSSTGVLIRHCIRGLYSMVIEYLDSRTSQSPMTLMLITTDSSLLDSVVCQIYKGVYVGYNLLLAHPPFYEIEDPHHRSLVYVGAEWLWTRYSLLKVSGFEEETRGLVDIGGFQKFSCESCHVDSFRNFADFIEHCETSELHQALREREWEREKAEREKAEREREWEREKAEKAEKAEREKAEREREWEKAEKAEREKAEKAREEKAEVEKAEREKADEVEKVEREKAEREKAEKEKAEKEKANNLEIGDEGGESSFEQMNLKEFEEDSNEERKKQMMDLRKNFMEQMNVAEEE
ncbi:unnamed protein product [Eruca vesicaria subsp. sativa]|uniref:NYN domain-containing protein n=1 Tax=Eruca vesicaria subsp. sativa TaxID=29727 RepID=A0ABC8KRA1_ERUVS|nr:unnamed protein product [Eruca vesicaria subsp. sativa]